MPPSIHAITPFRSAILHLKNRLANGNSRTALLERYGINLVLDVGANEGQYARQLMKHGYPGRIVSFEPLPDAFEILNENRWGFPAWQAEPFALGSEHTTATLNIAGNSMSSSMHTMLETHLQAAPESAYVGDVDVDVQRLDEVFDRYRGEGDRVFLKIDVQGHEQQVLEGASGCLDQILGMEIELSMVPLYGDQTLWRECIEAIQNLGFELASLVPGFCDPKTGIMLQSDGIFMRKSAVAEMQKAG